MWRRRRTGRKWAWIRRHRSMHKSKLFSWKWTVVRNGQRVDVHTSLEIHSDAAEIVISRTDRIRKVQARSLLNDGSSQHCGERSENADHVNSRWVTTEEHDFPSGQRQQGTWVGLEDGKEWMQSGVRCIRIVHWEQDDEWLTVASRTRRRVRRGHDGNADRKRTLEWTVCWEAGHERGPHAALTTCTSLKKTKQRKETQEKTQSEEARHWDDRSSWAWTGRLEEYTRTKWNATAVTTPGSRQELQQTLKNWDTEDQEWSWKQTKKWQLQTYRDKWLPRDWV